MPEELLDITESLPTPFLLIQEDIVRRNIKHNTVIVVLVFLTPEGG